MSYDVKWSEEGFADYQSILKYLNENWGKNSAVKFEKIVWREIEIISAMPGIFPYINKVKN